MTNPFANAIAAASGASPMASGSVPIVRSRTLLVDGDGLGYYCAGNDDTEAGEARAKLVDKVRSAARVVGADRILVLLTLSGSHKGHRYAIARAKPYQGQRANSRRPKNWGALRDYMLDPSFPFGVHTTDVAEADDLFGWYAYNQPDHCVIYTQDKDMRMLPGMHLDWVSHRAYTVPHTWTVCRKSEFMYNIAPTDCIFNEKQYGHKWFWLQMLHGDTADNIPGLPKYVLDGKLKPVGEVTAGKLLADEQQPHLKVADLYRGYYGDRWIQEYIEQACLLWMRRVPEHWDDCLKHGGPLYWLMTTDDRDFAYAVGKAYAEIERRVLDADIINSTAAVEVNGDSEGSGNPSSEAEQPLCHLPASIV